MGLKNRGEAETETCGLSEALLFATMCIVGLPVDVHVRDGSVYSGTFHTASVDGQYGIVLKETRLTKKGKCATNVANGSVIRTLVILSGDLVQVVAKGVFGPADGESGRMVMDDVEATIDNVPHPGIFRNDLKDLDMFGADKRKINQNRGSTKKKIHANGFVVRKSEKDQDGMKVSPHHLGDEKRVEHLKESRTRISENGQVSFAAANRRHICDNGSKGEYEQSEHMPDVHTEKRADEVQSSSSSDTCRTEEKSVVEEHLIKEQVPNGVSWKVTEVKLDNQFSERSSSPSSPDAVSSTVSSASNSVLNNFSESCHSSSLFSVDSASLQSVESNKKSKEFKLNPGAKVFFPSFANALPATSPVEPSYANSTYLPGTSPILPIAAAQPDAGITPFAPRTSIPAKVVPFNNLTAGIGSSNSQLSQPISGNMASRMQPLRYGGQYHAVQTAPAYAPPNSQAVMVGRLGQLVYMQPVTHDLVQTTAAIPQVSARPLVSAHHVHYLKHQGTVSGQNMQVCMPSPFAGVGQQTFMMQSPIPLMQPPIPSNRPIPIQGPNVLFGAQFT